MRRLIVCTNLSLDGVMQGPGRPDEDGRGGFTRGGWGVSYNAMAHVGPVFAETDALLLGRRTYEDFYDVWPKRPESPFTPWLTNVRKYVASRTLREPLPWGNSVLLGRNIEQAIAAAKREAGKNILVMGSGNLVRSLMPTGLIDEYVLLVHPLVLGAGQRLFPDEGAPMRLTLTSSATTPTGVMIGTYAPAGVARGADA